MLICYNHLGILCLGLKTIQISIKCPLSISIFPVITIFTNAVYRHETPSILSSNRRVKVFVFNLFIIWYTLKFSPCLWFIRNFRRILWEICNLFEIISIWSIYSLDFTVFTKNEVSWFMGFVKWAVVSNSEAGKWLGLNI